MTFDLNLAVMAAALGVQDVDKLEPGETAKIELILTVPVVLPFSAGPGQGPITAPLGNIRFSLDRDQAVDFFQKGLEAAEGLPKGSNLVLANDIKAVEHAAEHLKKVTG